MLREQLGSLIKLWNWSTRLGYLRTTSADLVCFLGTRAPFGMEKLSKRLLTAKQYDCQKMRRQNTSQGLEAIITNLKFYELNKFKGYSQPAFSCSQPTCNHRKYIFATWDEYSKYSSSLIHQMHPAFALLPKMHTQEQTMLQTRQYDICHN